MQALLYISIHSLLTGFTSPTYPLHGNDPAAAHRMPPKSKSAFLDSISMDTVKIEVMSSRQQMALIGRSVQTLSPTNTGASAASALADAGVFLKNYGLSGSATISRRGADPTQTQVMWNSLPINNPMLGMGDFTILMPLGMQVQLLEGGNTSLLGSGSVGGTVLLNSKLEFIPQSLTEIYYQYGSLGEHQKMIQSQWGSKQWAMSATLLNSTAQNRFAFSDPGLQMNTRWMSKSQVNRSLMRIAMGRKWEKAMVKLHGEMAEVDRGLGFMLGSLTSLGHQLDKSIKTMVEGNQLLGVQQKVKGTLRLGYVHDYIDFLEGRIGAEHAISVANTLHAQTEWQVALPKKMTLLFGGDFQWQQADINAYLGKVNRQLPANFVSLSGMSHVQTAGKTYRLQYVFSSRYEWHENIPTGSFSLLLGKEKQVKEKAWKLPLQYKLNVHNSFRRPTLNDLYWYIPSGRTALYSEKGNSAELGFVLGNALTGNFLNGWLARGVKHGQVLGNAEITAFYRQLDKPILWMPAGAIWRPMNLMGGGQYVGIAYQSQCVFLISAKRISSVRVFSQGEWVRTSVKSSAESQPYQQIFIPNYTGAAGIQVKSVWGDVGLLLKSTGKRFIQTDNLVAMKSFNLLDISWSKPFVLPQWKMQGKFHASCENVMGVVYQTVPNRPMPKQVFRLGISIQWLQHSDVNASQHAIKSPQTADQSMKNKN